MTGAKMTSYKNALAIVLLTRGIPIIYYGSEQAFSGGSVGIAADYEGYTGQREVMWPLYDTNAPLYSFLSRVIAARKLFGLAGRSLQQTEVWKDTSIYAFTRGPTLVAVTNTVASSQAILPPSSNPFPANSRACDFMSDRTTSTSNCVQSKTDGSFNLALTNGNFAFFVPARALNVQLNLSSAIYGSFPFIHLLSMCVDFSCCLRQIFQQ